MLKWIVITLVSIVACSQATAQGNSGIRFVSGDWKTVLNMAKQANKPVFVDMYTTWCGPCKLMDKEVFITEKVGSMFNTNFISVKVDAERGEGLKITRMYDVGSYPTFLFVDPAGNLFFKHIGSLSEQNFLELARAALKESKSSKPIALWEAEHKAKKNDPKFLYEYIIKRKSLGLDARPVIEQYLAALPADSLQSATVKTIITNYNVSIDGLGIQLLLQLHAGDPYSTALNGPYWSLHRVLYQNIETAGPKNDFELFRKITRVIDRMYDEPAVKKRASDKALFVYYSLSQDTLAMKNQAIKYATEHIMNVNVDSLKKADAMRLQKAILFQFSTNDTLALQKQKKYKDFVRLFRSESKNRANDILEICNTLCNACGARVEDAGLLKQAKGWLQKGKLFYYDVNASAEVTKSVSDCLDKSLKAAASQKLKSN
jgi:thiol-disulfide isomerase/thioredoxin